MRNAAYTGQLYQLYSKNKVSAGAYVQVNGPWDTFGTVLSSAPTTDGRFLNQIRGVRPRAGERPVASF